MQKLVSVSIRNIKLMHVLNETERRSAIRQIYNYVNKHGKCIEKIYFISSIECYAFLDPLNLELLNKVILNYPNYSFLSIGCVSFYGCLLEFINSTYQRALLISIEGNRARLQNIIDCLGYTHSSGQALYSQEGYAICVLDKVSNTSSTPTYWLKNVSILARLVGTTTIISTATKLRDYLNSIHNKTDKIISPENNTIWTKYFINAFGKLSDTRAFSKVSEWLPSVEMNNHHYHSLKPIHEMLRYAHYLNSGYDLIILTVGSGGRIGVLQISSNFTGLSSIPNINKICINPFNYACNDQHRQLHSLNKSFEFIDNLFFEWSSPLLAAQDQFYDKCL